MRNNKVNIDFFKRTSLKLQVDVEKLIRNGNEDTNDRDGICFFYFYKTIKLLNIGIMKHYQVV